MRIHTVSTLLSAAHLIETDRGLILVDAGAPGNADRILGRMGRLGRDDLRLIFITHAHFDHFGSAAALRRRTGAAIAVHEQDAQALERGETRLGHVRGRGRLMRRLLPLAERIWPPEPTPPDILLRDGDSLEPHGLPGRVVHTPGHTPGSASLLLQESIAFVGDLLSTVGRPHPQRFYAQDWQQLARSLRRLQKLNPTWCYPGHGARPLGARSLGRLAPFLPSGIV